MIIFCQKLNLTLKISIKLFLLKILICTFEIKFILFSKISIKNKSCLFRSSLLVFQLAAKHWSMTMRLEFVGQKWLMPSTYLDLRQLGKKAALGFQFSFCLLVAEDKLASPSFNLTSGFVSDDKRVQKNFVIRALTSSSKYKNLKPNGLLRH